MLVCILPQFITLVTQYVFLSMTSRDSMLVPAPTCSLGSSNLCIFASPLFPPFPTSRGIRNAWIEGGSIEEFECVWSRWREDGVWRGSLFPTCAYDNTLVKDRVWRQNGKMGKIYFNWISFNFFFFFEITSILDVTIRRTRIQWIFSSLKYRHACISRVY